MEEARGGERFFCCIAVRVGKDTSFCTHLKHHLSIFVFLNWKADSNISSVGFGGGGSRSVKKQQKSLILAFPKPGQHRP